jgi:hypothetical protein
MVRLLLTAHPRGLVAAKLKVFPSLVILSMLSSRIAPSTSLLIADARAMLSSKGIDVDAIASAVDGEVMSAFVGAQKLRSP